MRVCLPRFGFVFRGISTGVRCSIHVLPLRPSATSFSQLAGGIVLPQICIAIIVLMTLLLGKVKFASPEKRQGKGEFYSVVWIIAGSLCSGIGFYLWLCLLYVTASHTHTQLQNRCLAFPLRRFIMPLITQE